METLVSMITETAVEIVTIVIGVAITYLVGRVKVYVDKLEQKDELGIIDLITDRAVEYAEAELKGSNGEAKRDFAIKKATAILQSKGIHITYDEIVAGIEGGVIKLKSNTLKPIIYSHEES